MNYPNHVISFGSTNSEAVKAIKVRLNLTVNAGLDDRNPNFGISTAGAVKEFQKRNQLLSDGVVGELTWQRLFSPNVIIKPSSLILRVRALEIADTYLFVRELTGRNDGKEVEMFLKSVGLPKGYAWCMAFVYFCFLKSAAELVVPNPVPRTAGVLDCYSKARKYKVEAPQEGDQFIMDFGGGKGHTGIVSEVKSGRVFTIEGNTASDPAYQGEDREGNGVFERRRETASIKAFLRYK